MNRQQRPVYFLLVFILMSLWHGLATWIILNWSAPLFGIPAISFGKALAVWFSVQVLHPTPASPKEVDSTKYLTNLVLDPIMNVAVGWVLFKIFVW